MGLSKKIRIFIDNGH